MLHQAALWDNAELLEDLLDGDELAYINSADSWGRTSLHAAATTDSSDCLRILVQVLSRSYVPELSHLKFNGPDQIISHRSHFSVLSILLNISKMCMQWWLTSFKNVNTIDKWCTPNIHIKDIFWSPMSKSFHLKCSERIHYMLVVSFGRFWRPILLHRQFFFFFFNIGILVVEKMIENYWTKCA